jgi:hypothetical protein
MHRPPLPPREGPWYWLLLEAESSPEGAVGKIKLKKKLKDSIGNRTRDLPASNAVSQPISLQHTTSKGVYGHKSCWFQRYNFLIYTHYILSSSSQSNEIFLSYGRAYLYTHTERSMFPFMPTKRLFTLEIWGKMILEEPEKWN